MIIELERMQVQIDEILSSDYNPSVDDGVCKNIATLQQHNLLKDEILNKKQLDKYTKAEW